MIIEQAYKLKDQKWNFTKKSNLELKQPLVLVFANRYRLEESDIHDQVKKIYPDANIIIGSTAGEILEDKLLSGSTTLTALSLEKSTYTVASANVSEFEHDSYETAKHLASQLSKTDLKHVIIISDGSFVNGSALIKGLTNNGVNATISGGLCGDGGRFEKTLVGLNSSPIRGEVVVIGFYGDSLEINCSQYCGWNTFGPKRTITKSKGNILYEIDNQPALDLYKKYLGPQSKELPKAAIYYPLYVQPLEQKEPYVRTVLSINEEQKAMVLAGNAPQGAQVQLMMTSVDSVIDGANLAARLSIEDRNKKPDLALLISCVGRRMLMDQRTEEELEEVSEILGTDVPMCGFYSYGEIAPLSKGNASELHNQTMTITLISE